MPTVPGLGVAIPIGEFVTTSRQALDQLEQLAEDRPDYRLVRNQVGNFAILDKNDIYRGYVDFRGGKVSMMDQVDWDGS